MAISVTKEILKTDDWFVEVEITAEVYRDGIGGYEFWGEKCFDEGRWCVDIESIEPVFADESPELRQEIQTYINHNFDGLVEYFTDKWDFEEQNNKYNSDE